MKKQLMAILATTLMAGAAFAGGHAKEVKLGISWALPARLSP